MSSPPGDRVTYVCVERKPAGHEVVTGTVVSSPGRIVKEQLCLFGGPVRVVAWRTASPELRAKGLLADRTLHPVCAVCLSDLTRPPRREPTPRKKKKKSQPKTRRWVRHPPAASYDPELLT